MERNDFLRKFIEMRKTIAPTPAAAAELNKKEPMSKKTKKGSLIREVLDGSISHIIEEKPPRKKVEEYFQTMCNELTAAKMK
jgi:hypothetical protein